MNIKNNLAAEDARVLDLAAAVIIRAMNDYEAALRKVEQQPARASEIVMLERFFLSDYGQALSFGYGAMIINECKRRVACGDYRKLKSIKI